MLKKGLTLAPILCDGMILQRDQPNVIYGLETESTSVTVVFIGTQYTSNVDSDFEFEIELPPMKAGGPYTLMVKGSQEITLVDVYFGDVYILSGQSNMELPVRRVLDVSHDEIATACEPLIRQYLMPATYNFRAPEKFMTTSTWNKAVGEELMGFSAVGYFFAKQIKDAYQIPIGLIMTAVGGSTIEAWMKPDTLRQFGEDQSSIEAFKELSYFNQFIEQQQHQANEWLQEIKSGEPLFLMSEDYRQWNTCQIPSLISEYGIAPFQGSIYFCKEIFIEADPSEEVKMEDPSYIYMGSMIDSDCIWINGAFVGSTDYRYPPRKYMIPQGVLKKGSNRVMVRLVINNTNGGTILEKPYYIYHHHQKIQIDGQWYYRIGKAMQAPMPDVLFPPLLPSCFYHTAVVPLANISIKGVLWYQGESNTGEPYTYADKFKAMVHDWRALVGWNVPFLYAQLSYYKDPIGTGDDSGWIELREQQRLCLELDNVAMVETMDIGETYDVHPQNKKEVGVRLAKAAARLYSLDTSWFD